MLDLLIIGSSAAGASAGVYAARRHLNFKIVAKETGGEVALAGEVGNYPGWGETNGIDISQKFQDHLKIYNADVEVDVTVKKISRRDDGTFEIIADKLGEEVSYEAKTVIVTTGVHPRKLGIEGEEEFRGKGVTYCTTCDGPLFRGKTVATIGGGNSGLESALMLNEIAEKVYLINLYDNFSKGEPILVEKVKKAENVEIIYNAKTKKIIGDEFVNSLVYEDKDGNEQTVDVQGVFVHIGVVPNSEFLPEDVEKNNFGEILVDKYGKTNIPGFFAAGDVTDVPKQIAIASGQGVSAALSAVDYLNKLA